MSTDEDVKKLTAALAKERIEHKAAREALKAANDKFVEPIGDNPNTARLQQLVAAGIKAGLAERGGEQARIVGELTAELTAAKLASANASAALDGRTVADAVRAACIRAHVIESAIPDAITQASLQMKVTAAGIVTPEGLDPAGFIDACKQSRPYWWAPGKGAGSRGSSGDSARVHSGPNPFAKGDGWSLTAQSELITRSPETAAMLAAAAGVSLGGR
jgi:hypothetical protein